jgi:hypothetical protein
MVLKFTMDFVFVRHAATARVPRDKVVAHVSSNLKFRLWIDVELSVVFAVLDI